MITLLFDQSFASEQDRLSEGLVKHINTSVNRFISNVPDGEIFASLVGDQEIQRLNRMYRGRDSVTDVLSFAYKKGPEKHKGMGDIVISLMQAKRQAQDEDLELELTDLLVHGTLHVLGFDHEEPQEAQSMFSLQDRIVADVL